MADAHDQLEAVVDTCHPLDGVRFCRESCCHVCQRFRERLLGVDPERDAPGVRLVEARERLERDREADLHGDATGLVAIRNRSGRQEVDPSLLDQPPSRPVGVCRRAGNLDGSDRRRQAGNAPRRVERPVGEPYDGADRGLDLAVDGDGCLAQGRRGGRTPVHRLDDERASRLGRGSAHAAGDGDFSRLELVGVLAVAAEVPGQQDRVDFARCEEQPGDALEVGEILLAAAGQVDRVPRRRGRGEDRCQALGEIRPERGQAETGGGREVGCDHAVPTAVRDDGDPPPARKIADKGCLCEVDQLLRGRDALDPGRAAGCVDRDELADERAGV